MQVNQAFVFHIEVSIKFDLFEVVSYVSLGRLRFAMNAVAALAASLFRAISTTLRQAPRA